MLEAVLFTNAPVDLPDWSAVFDEMKAQAVAALPGEWLKAHPVSPSWLSYCALQQGNWVRVMHEQGELCRLLEENGIPAVIIKGAAAAVYYPHPSLRSMGDVDVLVKRADHARAASLLEANGYALTHEKGSVSHHYCYSRNNISVELHRRLGGLDDANEALLSRFENGIENRTWKTVEGFRFPMLPPVLNGLALIFHINQHLRSGLGLRQIIDWMMYVNSRTAEEWEQLVPLLRAAGMERLALTVTAMCQKYLGLRRITAADGLPVDDLMAFIMQKGNFGRKAGFDGQMESFALLYAKPGAFFRRLQLGGLCRWKAAKKHRVLRPFAWLYQGFRVLGELFRNHAGVGTILARREKGKEQRQLLSALGLNTERTIRNG